MYVDRLFNELTQGREGSRMIKKLNYYVIVTLLLPAQYVRD